jgi:RNA polymerase sigma factor (sigma-70 family)
MEDVPKPRLVDGRGDPLAPHIEVALTRLLPRFQQEYPALRDDLVRSEVLDDAARRIAERERRSGPVDKIYAYAWTALRNATATWFRQGANKVAERTLPPEHSELVLGALEASTGTAEQIEQEIFLREVMAQLTPEERVVVTWKSAGYSSEEIGRHRGTSAAAVDTLFSRAKDKVRAALGIDRKRTTSKPMGRPRGTGRAQQTGRESTSETPDGE